MPKSKFKVVWGAIEREEKTFWAKVGLAWEGRDGTLFARLTAFPISGRIWINGEYDDGADPSAMQVEEALQ
jgi:hypothetical protein